jgi:hypothetical protein
VVEEAGRWRHGVGRWGPVVRQAHGPVAGCRGPVAGRWGPVVGRACGRARSGGRAVCEPMRVVVGVNTTAVGERILI